MSEPSTSSASEEFTTCPDCGRGWDGLNAGERLRQHMLDEKHGKIKDLEDRTSQQVEKPQVTELERPSPAPVATTSYPHRDRGLLHWGIALFTVLGGVLCGVYLGNADRHWELGMIYLGGGVVGAVLILGGWSPASNLWRALAIAVIVLHGGYWAWTFYYPVPTDEELANVFNDVEVGDCVDREGSVVSCDSEEAERAVTRVIRYDSDDSYPNFDNYYKCSGLFYYPKYRMWVAGGRTVTCVE